MDDCNVYVNECSAIGQIADDKVEQAIMDMLDCLKVIESCDLGTVAIKKYYSGSLYTSALSRNITIDNLHNKELKRRVKLSLRGASCWDNAPLTDHNATYLHRGHDVSQTSMSESYEQDSSLLVNFVLSYMEEPLAEIEKTGAESIKVTSFSDRASLLSFVVSKGWRRNQYDLSSSIPPHDEESILSDTDRFELTGHRYNGRAIYRRKNTGHLCYIDSKHSGPAAHIEVFNETTKKMLGTLKINEEVEHHPLTNNEKSRKIRLD